MSSGLEKKCEFLFIILGGQERRILPRTTRTATRYAQKARILV